MSNVARRRFVLGCILAVLIGVFMFLFVACGPTVGRTDTGDGTGVAGPADAAGSFAIEGNASAPISPGVMAPLDLRLTNPHDVPMSVTDLHVSVQKVIAPNASAGLPCAIGDFTVGQVSSSVKITVVARATSTLSSLGVPLVALPHVGMLDRPANQDGCKGASLMLGYSASGMMAN